MTSAYPGVTWSWAFGAEGVATDPVSTASIPGPQSYKGCRKMSPAVTDAGVAWWSWDAHGDVLLGGPVVELGYTTTAPDTELNIRLWDVTADGSAQALVTRGTYRSLDGPGANLRARFEIAPTGYRFAAGHTIKLEVTANDAPYRGASNVPAVVVVDGVTLSLPTR
jgi:hypothetical protein